MSTEQDNSTNQPHTLSKRDRVWRWMRRYLRIPALLFIALLCYLTFFGEYSAQLKAEYQHQLDSLQQCLDREQDSLQYYRELNRRLSCDPELMEQVVREQYHMNRPGEDVFVFTNDQDKQ